jgi:hypothetical protein
MKRIVIILLFVLGMGHTGFSQRVAPGTPPAARPNLQGIRIEFITRHLKLTPEEAPFWSLFYQYTDELTKARNEQPDDVIATEEKVLSIRKKYRTDFKKILGSDDRVMKVFTIDREFNKIVKDELEKRIQQRRNNNQ